MYAYVIFSTAAATIVYCLNCLKSGCGWGLAHLVAF